MNNGQIPVVKSPCSAYNKGMTADTEKIQAHYAGIRRILLAILLLNWLVAAAKIIYGMMTGFTSMTADGFHSLSDGASNVLSLIGIHFASQPVDKDHPYGHRKYETLFAMGIAGMLFILAFNLLKEGIVHISNPGTPRIDTISFLVMIATLVVNIFVMRYEYAKGKALKSDILVSDSLHTRADILTSLSVIGALAGAKLGFPVIDPVITIFISLFVAHSGWDIIRESSLVLCDSAANIDERRLAHITMGISGVKSCRRIRTRGRQDDIHVDMCVTVAGHMHMDRAHAISEEIENAIKKDIPGITDVVVHLEADGHRGHKGPLPGTQRQ